MSERTNEFLGQNIAVIGLAATGLATARVLQGLGANVTVYDGKPESELDAARVAEAREIVGVRLQFGTSEIDWANTDLVVPSPGVPRYAPPLVEAVQRGVLVLGEIEVAYRLAQAPILAITGTNGKTTTTALLGAICRAAGLQTWVAGNIAEDAGVRLPLIQAAMRAPAQGVIVAEISSFQLEWVYKFRPKVAAWLNLSADHLDRYKDMAEYARAKSNIFRAQTADDVAVINGDDYETIRYSEGVGKAQRGAFTVEGGFVAHYSKGEDSITYSKEGWLSAYYRQEHAFVGPLPLPGRHNRANMIAAVGMADAIGVPLEMMARAIKTFKGVAHRMEFVRDVNGVRYINNSMCTNPAAVKASVSAIDTPLVAIAGGLHKGGDLAPMAAPLAKHARRVVLIGQSKAEVADALQREGYAPEDIAFAETLPDAVAQAAHVAQPGETVMLVPGCASFDMFTGFEQRGQVFRDAVNALEGDA